MGYRYSTLPNRENMTQLLRVLPAKSKGNVRRQENEREKIGHCSAQRGIGDQITKLAPDPTRAAFRGTMVYKCETERERKQSGEQKQ